MTLEPNDGTRPSRLTFGRRAVGEIAGAIPEDVAAELARAADRVAPFDASAIRQRAAGIGAVPQPANNWRWFTGAAVAAAAAGVAFLVQQPADRPYVGVRGGNQLALYQLAGAQLAPWDGEPLAEGDIVGVRVKPGESDAVVVLSVDGAGVVTVFWPEDGAEPETVATGGWTELPGTIVLDGAPGPEVFVAVFDQVPSEAEAAAARAWRESGSAGVRSWGEDVGDAIVVERR